jgi:hypothetical protein
LYSLPKLSQQHDIPRIPTDRPFLRILLKKKVRDLPSQIIS